MAAQDQTLAAAKSEENYVVQLPNGIGVRRYRDTDAQSLSHHGSNKNIWNNLRNRMPHPYTESDAKWWIEHSRDESTNIRSGPWTAGTGSQGPPVPAYYAITVNNEAVGSIGLDFGAAEDIYFRTAEVGYWLSEEHWGKGIMSAIVPPFVEWSWKTWGLLVRLNGEVSEKNVASTKCLKRAGFVVEGRRVNSFVKNREIRSHIFMGCLRPEGTEPKQD